MMGFMALAAILPAARGRVGSRPAAQPGVTSPA
jgi:hypothetical protein